MKLVVISPHLDDGVFGCGIALAGNPGAVVITVFAGVPNAALRTDWDRRCGFGDAHSAMAARRDEDRRALAMLQARPLWLDFLDSQYAAPVEAAAIGDALRQALQSIAPQAVLLPMGLFHSDHRLVHEAMRLTYGQRGEIHWFAYEDGLYRRIPGLLQQRLAELAADGICATPAELPVATAAPPGTLKGTASAARSLKRRAVRAYASQLRALDARRCADLEHPERYWRLECAREAVEQTTGQAQWPPGPERTA